MNLIPILLFAPTERKNQPVKRKNFHLVPLPGMYVTTILVSFFSILLNEIKRKIKFNAITCSANE